MKPNDDAASGNIQPSLRDYSYDMRFPRISSWATLSRPFGTRAVFCRSLLGHFAPAAGRVFAHTTTLTQHCGVIASQWGGVASEKNRMRIRPWQMTITQPG